MNSTCRKRCTRDELLKSVDKWVITHDEIKQWSRRFVTRNCLFSSSRPSCENLCECQYLLDELMAKTARIPGSGCPAVYCKDILLNYFGQDVTVTDNKSKKLVIVFVARARKS